MSKRILIAVLFAGLIGACDRPAAEGTGLPVESSRGQKFALQAAGLSGLRAPTPQVLAAGADLEVASVGLPEGTVVAGAEKVTEITVIVRNSGTEALIPGDLPRNGEGQPVVPFRLATAWMNGSDALEGFGSWGIPVSDIVHPNDMITFKFPVSDDPRWLPEGVDVAEWVIRVELDPEGRIADRDEDNNVSHLVEFTVVRESGAYPEPELALRYGTLDRSDEAGNLWDDFHLSVTNWDSFPRTFHHDVQAYGAESPCPNRMKVSVHDAETGRELLGDCGLKGPEELSDLVLRLPSVAVPEGVFLMLQDRVDGFTVRSNTLRLPAS